MLCKFDAKEVFLQAAGSAEQQSMPVNWRRTAVSAMVQVCTLHPTSCLGSWPHMY